MAIYRNRSWLVERPHAATFLLMTANVIIFGLCLRASGSAEISTEVLFDNGAMYTQALSRHEYWRLIASGLLHTNPLHLTTNMLCLVLWGGLLESRIGSFYFLVIYVCAMVAGAVLSDLHSSGPYLSAGASGAISGILGALFCLWVLGKIDLSVQFFVVNIGLNVILAMSSPRIDWVAHVGGLTAGLIACALIDILERANRLALRCKFPEFVKVNGAILAVMPAVLLWSSRPGTAAPGSPEDGFPLLAYAAACLVAIKLVDLVLPLKRGLAIIVVTFAAANAGLVVLAALTVSPLDAICASAAVGPAGPLGALIDLACANPHATVHAIAACAFATTLLLYASELERGIKDVGFIGTTLRAERNRREGI
jgi:membrane associated rhomboid family serine protease